MDEEVTYDAYVEVQPGGACLAQLLDLPGCFARAGDESEAVAALAAAIPDYYAWLRRHDDYTPDVRGPFRVATKQREPIHMVNGRAVGAFFAPDAEPITGEDLDWMLALLDWVYEDLVALLAARPVAAVEPPSSGGVPQRSYAEQTAQEQLWLVSRIEPNPAVPDIEQLPGTALDRLRQVWRASAHRLRGASDPERERVLELDGEQWSLRKVLRRSVLHARMRLAGASEPANPA